MIAGISRYCAPVRPRDLILQYHLATVWKWSVHIFWNWNLQDRVRTLPVKLEKRGIALCTPIPFWWTLRLWVALTSWSCGFSDSHNFYRVRFNLNIRGEHPGVAYVLLKLEDEGNVRGLHLPEQRLPWIAPLPSFWVEITELYHIKNNEFYIAMRRKTLVEKGVRLVPLLASSSLQGDKLKHKHIRWWHDKRKEEERIFCHVSDWGLY